MPGEVFEDSYRFDSAQAEDAWKRLAELSKNFTVQLQVQAAESTRMATQLEHVAESSQKTERAISDFSRGMREVHAETKRAADAQQGMVDFLKEDLSKSIFSAAARYDLLKEVVIESAKAVAEFIKHGIEGLAEQEVAEARLDATLRSLSLNSEGVRRTLLAQADAMEHELYAASAETINQMQQLLLAYGVAPSKIEPIIRATLDYAAATGKDAVSSLEQLTSAVDSGTEELRRFGLTVTSTGDNTRDLVSASEELEKKWGGSAAASAQGLRGEVEALKTAWDDLSKAVATFLQASGISTTVLGTLKDAAEGLTYLLSPQGEAGVIQNQMEIEAGLMAQKVALVQDIAKIQKAARENEKEGLGALNTFLKQDIQQRREQIAAIDREIAKTREVRAEINRNAEARKKEFDAAQGADAPSARSAAKLKEEADARRKAFEDAAKKDNAAQEAARRQAEETRKRVQNYERKRDVDAVLGDLNAQVAATFKAAKDEQNLKKVLADAERSKRDIELEEKKRADQEYTKAKYAELKKQAQLVDQEIEQERKAYSDFWQEQQQEFASFGAQLVDLAASEYRDSLLERTKFNQQYQKLSIERRQADLAEQGIIKSRAEIEQEMADQEAAAQQKRLAEVLATISSQSAVKAVFETAEGFAALATANPLATQHFIAAAAYASVAALAGGGAAAISANRGVTADEQTQLDSMQSQSDRRDARDASQSSQSGRATAGTLIEVYNYGIAGQTQAAQARELARLTQKYNARRTGAGSD